MILVVDDDPAFLEQVGPALEPKRGVLFAGDAARAMELAVGLQELSVALIDLDLPGADGFTLIDELRERVPGLPTIAISGVFQPDVLESAKALGATAVLRKPITPEWKTVVDEIRESKLRKT
jgi:CheY-like chemotaxis protein